ncbi:MAG TPA: hypothetical protein VG013_25915 [Gemmataceae bacterium]|nr:hypothetical protein [Gemmataceae bacterium]
MSACASYLAAPFLDDPVFEDVTTVHVVRHPVRVILSFLNDIQFFQHADTDPPHATAVVLCNGGGNVFTVPKV